MHPAGGRSSLTTTPSPPPGWVAFWLQFRGWEGTNHGGAGGVCVFVCQTKSSPLCPTLPSHGSLQPGRSAKNFPCWQLGQDSGEAPLPPWSRRVQKGGSLGRGQPYTSFAEVGM